MVHVTATALSALAPLAATSKTSSSSAAGTLLPIILLIAVGYFLLVRPQRNRQRKLAETRSQLQPGAEVLTTSGMYATVIAVEDSAIVLEVAPGVHSRFAPQAVSRVLTPVEEPEAEDGAEPAEEPVSATVEPATAEAAPAVTPAVEG